MLFINTNYKNIENKYVIQGDVALISLLNNKGAELIAKIDVDDMEKVKGMGTWFAEWHKDFGSYLVQNISSTKINKKAKPLKQSLQSVILNTNPKAPIRHINGDTLDNRKCNIEIVERNTKNDFEVIDENTVAVILKDRNGRAFSKADLDLVITDELSWVEYKTHNKIHVIANTPKGRIYLDKMLMNPGDEESIHHINLNPLDCRRTNMEIEEIK